MNLLGSRFATTNIKATIANVHNSNQHGRRDENKRHANCWVSASIHTDPNIAGTGDGRHTVD